ncbi:MAG: hypothetical protein F4X47_02465 [Gammaproteobacteria bacterium]|nr:hypothetical protein [Gammaproteobacteria bacterium]MYC51161.1 hypothetical protein [Gammaproteobacteria bacterium]
MMGPDEGPLLTLEPLIDAVREGVEMAGWTLSGMQKTTSHQFEGRWTGESARSAYLFFHQPGSRNPVSVDVFLDETSQGLGGNLTLAVRGPSLEDLGGFTETLEELTRVANRELTRGHSTPVTLRATVPHRNARAADARTECRFRLVIPDVAIDAGARVVRTLSTATVKSFEALLASRVVADFLGAEDS